MITNYKRRGTGSRTGNQHRKMNTTTQTGQKRYTIIGKYQRLVMPKNGMPLFVSFHPHNLVKFTLGKIQKDKIPSFLKSIESWFEKLEILKIEEETIGD